jgi:transposase-like protein
MSEDEAKALREAVEQKQREQGRGPFEPELKEQLIAHVKDRYASGESVGKIARSLGLSEQTVWCWRKHFQAKNRGSAKLRQVAIALVEPQTEKHQLVVRGPAGLVVEGIALGDLVELWRRLA